LRPHATTRIGAADSTRGFGDQSIDENRDGAAVGAGAQHACGREPDRPRGVADGACEGRLAALAEFRFADRDRVDREQRLEAHAIVGVGERSLERAQSERSAEHSEGDRGFRAHRRGLVAQRAGQGLEVGGVHRRAECVTGHGARANAV
jgi:hypothetical protein